MSKTSNILGSNVMNTLESKFGEVQSYTFRGDASVIFTPEGVTLNSSSSPITYFPLYL